jgi:hypothetical protein
MLFLLSLFTCPLSPTINLAQTCDNNESFSINMYYVRGFDNNAVADNTSVGVRPKTLQVHYYADLPIIGTQLFSPFSHIKETAA